MLIISQNLAKYGISFPEDAIYRINLAWIDSINELIEILNKHLNQSIYLDLPIGRLKPPNNKYAIEDLLTLIKSNDHIKYFAISNVECKENLTKYINLLPNKVRIVPKIETPKGVLDIQEITDAIPYPEKIVMLDHDDLYTSLARVGESSKFRGYISQLVNFCEKNHIILLRIRGVIFSDEL